ncbi:hypothetical protein ZWY2020_018667 [Hordeum vulgare]|nr:hypothetical protein ZWY2020_018667 [Hordeum vulgare]
MLDLELLPQAPARSSPRLGRRRDPPGPRARLPPPSPASPHNRPFSRPTSATLLSRRRAPPPLAPPPPSSPRRSRSPRAAPRSPRAKPCPESNKEQQRGGAGRTEDFEQREVAPKIEVEV